jgi:nucleotide-binding universal stress UspA family protein
MFKQVIVATDGSPTSNRGLKAAIGLAASERAGLAIVHVIDDSSGVSYVGDLGYVPSGYIDALLDDLRRNGQRILAKAERAARDAGVEPRGVLVEAKGRSIADAILGEARKLRADVIVLGTHGRRGLRRALMGSDAEAVLRDARVPVLLVRFAAASSRDATPAASARKRAPRKKAVRGG